MSTHKVNYGLAIACHGGAGEILGAETADMAPATAGHGVVRHGVVDKSRGGLGICHGIVGVHIHRTFATGLLIP